MHRLDEREISKKTLDGHSRPASVIDWFSMETPEPPTPRPAPKPDSRPRAPELPPVADPGRRTDRPPRRWPILLGAFLLLAVVLLVPRFSRQLVDAPPELTLPAGSRLAVAPFLYRGEEIRLHAWVGRGLSEMVTRAFQATRGLDVVTPEALRRAVDERALDPESEISRARIRQLGLALGAEVVLEATVVERGEGYELDYGLYGPDGEVARAEVSGPELFALVETMVESVSAGLDPNAVPPSFRRLFTANDFLDRLYAMGLETLRTSGVDAARPFFEICLDAEPRFLAAKMALAECERGAGRLGPSSELYLEVLREAEELGERPVQARALAELADLAAFEGRYGEAGELLEQTASLYESLGDDGGREWVLGRQARLALAEGERAEAEVLFFELLQLQVEIGDRIGEAGTLLQLGTLALGGGEDAETAEELFGRARDLARRLDDVRTQMRAVVSLGEIAERQGELERAQELWAEALAFYRQRGDAGHESLLVRKLAEAALARGELETAEEHYLELLDLADSSGERGLRTLASQRLAWILLRLGYPYQARNHLERALEDRGAVEDPVALQRTIAWMAYEEGKFRLAVETQRAAKAMAGEAWRAEAEAFLSVYEKALAENRRLPLPDEAPRGAGSG